MGIKFRFFPLAIAFSTTAIFLEIVILRLLLPLARGIIRGDYTFIRNLFGFRSVIQYYPDAFQSSISLLVLLSVVMMIIVLIKNGIQYTASLMVSHQAQQVSTHIRKSVFDRYFQFGQTYFDTNNIEILSELLIGHTKKMGDYIQSLHASFSKLLSLFVYIFVMAIISWKLTLVVMILFPLLNLPLIHLIRQTKVLAENRVKEHKQLRQWTFDTLSCYTLVKTLGDEDQEKKCFDGLCRKGQSTFLHFDKHKNLIQPLQEIAMFAAILIAIFIIPYISQNQQLSGSLAGYFIFFFILRKTIPAFKALTKLRITLDQIYRPVVSIKDIFNDNGKYIISEGTREFADFNKEIRFQNLSFSYPEKQPVLNNINLCIKKNCLTAIVGPTGSGKTTLMQLLFRFYECQKGTILIDGVDIREFTLGSLRNHISLIHQDPQIFENTLRYNITYGIHQNVSDKDIFSVLERARLSDFVTQLPKQLDTITGPGGIQLSGGEKQRLAITRALLRDTQILILDEATSSVDIKTERLIREAISELIGNKTIIAIAHRLSTIKHAKHIIFLDKGEILEEGSFEELLHRQGNFYAHWQEQSSYQKTQTDS